MAEKSRLTLEERQEAVEACISGREGINECAQRRGIGGTTLQCWIRLYKMRGIEGLMPTVQIRKYSTELKLRAVEEYLSGNGSLSDICIKYDISRHGMLQNWIKVYNNHGDFKQPKSGGVIYMVKSRKTTLAERIEIVSQCIANNKDYSKTIEQHGVSYQQIYGWVRKYEKDGLDGLVDRRGKRKDDTSMTEVEKLQAQLKFKEAENLRLQMENELLKKIGGARKGDRRRLSLVRLENQYIAVHALHKEKSCPVVML